MLYNIQNIIFLGEEEDSSKPKKPTYIFYTSDNTVVKTNQDNLDDKESFTKPGGASFIMDPKMRYLLYSYYGNRIVKDMLVPKLKPKTIVPNLRSVGDMVYDKVPQKLYWLDDRAGKIGYYNLDDDEGDVLYEGLKSPKKLTIDKATK